MCPRTSWPLSSFTRNIVLGRASVISPSISIFSSLAMRPESVPDQAFWRARDLPRSGFLRLPDPVTQVGDGLRAVADLARVLRRLELLESAAQLRTLGNSQ